MPREERLQILPYPPVTAMPRGTVGRPVQERDLPALARGSQVLLQEVLLPLRVRTSIAVVQLAVEGDEMGVAPIEGVVALGAARAFERRWKFSRKAVPSPLITSWLPRTGKTGTVLMRFRYGAKKRRL